MRSLANRQALRVALIYIGLAAGWMLLSDKLLKWLVGDPHLRNEISIFKGWALLPVTGGLLFLMIRGLLQSRKQGVTGRKLAVGKLLESEACYRQLFELESDAVLLLDCETHRFVDVNQSAEQLYGYSRDEFLRMTEEDVFAAPEPARAIAGSGSHFAPLRWHRKKHGERFPVEINSKVFSCQGRCLKLATVRDTTARQQVMEMLEETTGQLLEGQHFAGLGSYVVDLNGSCKN